MFGKCGRSVRGHSGTNSDVDPRKDEENLLLLLYLLLLRRRRRPHWTPFSRKQNLFCDSITTTAFLILRTLQTSSPYASHSCRPRPVQIREHQDVLGSTPRRHSSRIHFNSLSITCYVLRTTKQNSIGVNREPEESLCDGT